jgi:NADPH2:quinone reductase
MKAMVIERSGAESTLQLRDVPEPVPGPREVLVRVRATALNRADLSQRAGRYRQQAIAKRGPDIAGLESAGEVEAIGEQVTRFAPGDRVMGQCSGGYAERLTVDERLLIPVPDRLDWPEAAATPVAFVTEHDAIKTNAQLQPGETVLVQAAGAAVGLAAVQLARFTGAGRIIGTVAGDAQGDLVRRLGADVAVDHEREDFEDVVARETDGRGVDVVIDHVGGPALAGNLRSLAVRGRLISVGRLGRVVGEIDLDLLARNRLRVIGVSFRTRTVEEYGDCVRLAQEDLLPALADGRLRPVVDRVFPLERALEAQERMAANRHLGKIVLCIDGERVE